MLVHGLSMVRGVGRRFAQALVHIVGLDPSMRVGDLTDRDITRIEEIIANPVENGIPSWMVNRQHDLKTGENRHITGTDLDLMLKLDLDRMKRTRSWKGIRHEMGLKVRGQRTRTTGRRGLVVGVMRKKKGQQQQGAKK